MRAEPLEALAPNRIDLERPPDGPTYPRAGHTVDRRIVAVRRAG